MPAIVLEPVLHDDHGVAHPVPVAHQPSAPRDGGRYSHRRKVRWLWSDPNGRKASDITPVKFARKTIYPLRQNDLDLGAISALIGQGGGEVTPTEPLPHVLIIDEINRANVSKVFGELITLIEPDKRLGMPNSLTLTLPYSRKSFGVPANLHIIGTMNTADRSIALLDTALRRRFTFREVAPEPRLLPEQVDGVPLRRVLDIINDRIEYLIDRDHRVGHAFFMACGSRDDIDQVMRDARPVKSLSEETRQKPSKRPVCSRSIASMTKAISEAFLPLV